MVKRIKRISPLSLGKFYALMMLGIALFFVCLYFLVGRAVFGHLLGNAGIAETGLLIAVPLLYSFVGFIFGILTAVIFNLVSSVSGGLEIEVE